MNLRRRAAEGRLLSGEGSGEEVVSCHVKKQWTSADPGVYHLLHLVVGTAAVRG